MTSLEQFKNQKYLNIETFRRNGESMKTPVWFVQDDGVFFVQTEANSGKVKRIRNNRRVNIAPCKMDGTATGAWAAADAQEITDAEIAKKVSGLLEKKYGLMKKIFSLQAARQGRKDTILELRLVE